MDELIKVDCYWPGPVACLRGAVAPTTPTRAACLCWAVAPPTPATPASPRAVLCLNCSARICADATQAMPLLLPKEISVVSQQEMHMRLTNAGCKYKLKGLRATVVFSSWQVFTRKTWEGHREINLNDFDIARFFPILISKGRYYLWSTKNQRIAKADQLTGVDACREVENISRQRPRHRNVDVRPPNKRRRHGRRGGRRGRGGDSGHQRRPEIVIHITNAKRLRCQLHEEITIPLPIRADLKYLDCAEWSQITLNFADQ
uniref:Uncharacterized protein n=1 Tax=Glossina austeni TaxID=7395 RepID=A0A1A9UD23_GLOAU